MHAARPQCIAFYTTKEDRYVAHSKRPRQDGPAQGNGAQEQSPTDASWITAAQLAEEAGCTVRRVRDLIQLGLVSRAIGKGRARRYTPTHVKQLQAVVQALDQANLTRGELLWVLDRDTPSRLRRQARDLELLAGPRDGSARVVEVQVEGVLTVSIAGTIAQHHRRLMTKTLGAFAQDLRARADLAERLRARLAIPPSLARSARASGGSEESLRESAQDFLPSTQQSLSLRNEQ